MAGLVKILRRSVKALVARECGRKRQAATPGRGWPTYSSVSIVGPCLTSVIGTSGAAGGASEEEAAAAEGGGSMEV